MQEIQVASTLDGLLQPALFEAATVETPRPLLVGLHTWSADRNNQRDTLLPLAHERNWNLLLPEFRGPNLVSNAIDHAASGTKVLVHAASLGDEVTVTVSNQGNPIPTDLLPVLFEAFHRGRTGIKARAGHLGLGLYIAHQIARSHGGSLSAQSSEGTTTFTMRLPRRSIPTET